MSDFNPQGQGGSAPGAVAPAAPPSSQPSDNQSTGVPAQATPSVPTQTPGPADISMEKSLASFFDWDSPAELAPAQTPGPLAADVPQIAAPKPQVPVEPAAAPAQGEVLQQTPEVDPALLAAMAFGQTPPAVQPQPGTQPQPQPQPQQTPPQTPVGSAHMEGFNTFAPDWSLPNEVVDAMASEDPALRNKATVAVMSAMGNAVSQRVLEHVATRVIPQYLENFQRQQEVVNVQRQQEQDFFGSYPDLKDYRPVVAKAAEIVAQKLGPQAAYTQGTRDQVGALARQFIKQFFGVSGAATAPSQTPGAVAPSAPVAPFMAGGARPGEFGAPPDRNSPQALLDELSW